MKEFDDYIFSLFIMAYLGWDIDTLTDESLIDYCNENQDCLFYKVKQLFPEEYCSVEQTGVTYTSLFLPNKLY